MHFRNIAFLLGFLIFVLACAEKEDIQPDTPDESNEVIREVENGQDSLTISYLALGDSYTIGEGVAEQARYPRQLVDSLIGRKVSVEKLKIVAATGWTTSNLSQALNREEIENGDYNLVSLLIGVNNQYQGGSLDKFREEFTRLLDRAIAYAGNDHERVFVISIPDWGVTPFGRASGNSEEIAEDIDRFNVASKAITASRGVKYFFITPISREARNEPDLIASDALHPSGKMYTRWVEFMLPDILDMLK